MSSEKVTIVKQYGLDITQIEIEVDHEKKEYEPYYKANVVQSSCPVCVSCRLFIDGPHRMSCVQGGPYVGYIEV